MSVNENKSRQSDWYTFIKRIFTAQFTIGLVIVIFFTLTSFLGSHFIPYNPNSLNLANAYKPPSFSHPFGTDYLGRDVMARTLEGGRISLEVGFVAGFIIVLLGGIIGVISGYFGGKTDIVIQRGVDITLAVPIIVFALVLLELYGSNTLIIIGVISLLSWPTIARITRAETLSMKEREFIYAEKLAGAKSWHIIFRHLIPNVSGSFIVYSGLAISSAILTQAALAYLGFGGVSVNWGFDLYEAQQYIGSGSWWMMVFPGLAITLTCLGFYLMSEGLRRTFLK